MSAADFAILAGIAATCLSFFLMLVVSMQPLGSWPAKTARRGDVEPGKL